MGNQKVHRKRQLKWAESSAFSLSRSPVWIGSSKLTSPRCKGRWESILFQTPKGAGPSCIDPITGVWPQAARTLAPPISLSQPWYCCCYQLSSKVALVPQKAARKQLIPITSNQQISFLIFWQFLFWRKKYVCVLGVGLNNKIGCQFSGLN